MIQCGCVYMYIFYGKVHLKFMFLFTIKGYTPKIGLK